MNKQMDKIPLKSKTAWNHLRTLKKATETVSTWPKWKQDAVVYREKSRSNDRPEVSE